jgi:hypothetical protein
VLLPEPNSVVRAEFLIPAPDSRDWRTFAEGHIYDLALVGSGDLVNELISVALTPEQHWRVRISDGRGVEASGMAYRDSRYRGFRAKSCSSRVDA